MKQLLLAFALASVFGLAAIPAHAAGDTSYPSISQLAQPVGWAVVPRWNTYPYNPYGYGSSYDYGYPYGGYYPYGYYGHPYGYYGYPYANPYGYYGPSRYYRYYEGPINPWRYNNRSLNPNRYMRPLR